MKYLIENDDEQQRRNNSVGTVFNPDDDQARHELAPETDLNRLMRRYSVYDLPQGQTFYGERDYDLDNAEAMHNLHALRSQALSKWESMSEEERSPWPTVGHFLTAVTGPAPSPVAPAQTAAPGAGAGAPPASETDPGKA